jgi:hypothetical protein
MGFVRSLAVAAAAGSVAFLIPAVASAQTQGGDPVSATGKGITGGALLGAEAVLLSEAILDVKPGWAYLVGGILGAGAGGFGGYYAEQQDSAKLSLYLLAGGMALAIPTTVAVLSATAYEPPADYTEDQGPVDEPVAEPPQPAGAAPAPAGATPPPAGQQSRSTPVRPAPARKLTRRSLHLPVPVLPPSLFGLDQGYLTLGVPAVEVRDVYSRREVFEYGVKQQMELRIPVFGAVF